MKNKTIYKIIFVIACIIFIICGAILIKLFIPEKDTMSQFINETDTTASSVVDGTTQELPENPINFTKLIKTNPDVYAWIRIPDTEIDYAIAQASEDKDDLFYLNHNIEGNYEFAGMIFSQRKNSLDFSDPVTVLYGHNMLNGSMFAGLHKFENKDFFDEHDTFYVYTPGHILTYKVVSAYIYDNRHILNTFDFTKKKDLKEYIQSVTSPKSFVCNVRNDIDVTIEDKILTLSTCTASSSQRYLVQGVLTNDEYTK